MKETWSVEPLGNILVERRETPDPSAIFEGRIPIIDKISFETGNIFLRNETTTKTNMILAHPGDLIVSGINAAKGAIAIYDPKDRLPVAATIHYGAYLPKKDRVDVQFVWWMLRSHFFRNLLLEHVPGGIKTELKSARLLPIPVPLPPLQEQHRIVRRIEEHAAQVATAQKLRKQSAREAAAIVPSTISQIFSNAAAKGWVIGRLGDYVIDDCYGTSTKTSDDKNGIPILRMGNIQNGRLDIRDLKYLHLSSKERSKLILKYGDILVNRTNSAELVGKSAVFEGEGDFSFASYLIRLRLDQDRADSRLVAAYINSPIGRAYMFAERRQMTGQANVNATKLKALPIALPPLSEQRRIVVELDALGKEVDALQSQQSETAAKLDALMPAILDRAFKGEL